MAPNRCWGAKSQTERAAPADFFLSQVQRAAHPHARPGHYVRVNLRRGHIHMPQQILQRADKTIATMFNFEKLETWHDAIAFADI
jgi:hypothetical protein